MAPAEASITLRAVGDRQRSRFTVTPRTRGVTVVPFTAVFTTNGREWRTEYTPLRHRGLPLRYFVKDAAALASVVDLHVDKGVRVGYVMGIGDEVPAALAQLGARVTLLARDDLATGDLARFDTIVTGTRAYAVRDDLRAHNRRLLDWVRGGGRMVVLYNTPEFVPAEFAPYRERCHRMRKRCRKRSAVVTCSRRSMRCFDTQPHHRRRLRRVGRAARIEVLLHLGRSVHLAGQSHDQGQLPQRGGWLTATVGKGRWTYMAYALHRQVALRRSGRV